MAISQSHYRFGIAELAESTHGWYAAEDATGEVRGLLCRNCNLVLGYVDDRRERLLGLIEYLTSSRTTISTSQLEALN